MSTHEPEPAEIGIRELRNTLADVLNDAAVQRKVTYVTSRGRRIAAIVPVHVADEALHQPDDAPPSG